MEDNTLLHENEGFESFYEGQVGQLKGEDWATSLRDEFLKLGLVCISQGRQECDGRANYQIIEIRCPDMQTQIEWRKRFLVACWYLKKEERRGLYI